MKLLSIDVKIIKNNQSYKRFKKSFNTNDSLSVESVKGTIKNEIDFPHEIVKEEFYYMSKELKDSDVVPFLSGNEFILTIK